MRKRTLEFIKLYLIVVVGFLYINTSTAIAAIELDYSFPNKYIVDSIKIAGNKYTDADLIVSISGLHIGSIIQIPGPEIANAINNIWNHNIVDNVNIYASYVSDNHVELVIEIIELPRLSKISFSGIDKKEEEILLDKLKLIVDKPISDAYLEETKYKVYKYFVDEGYYNVKVNITKLNHSEATNSAELKIIVDKGSEKIVGKFFFTGNNIIDADDLKLSMTGIREKARFTLIKNLFKAIPKFFSKNNLLFRPFKLDDYIKFYRANVIFSSSNFDEKKFEEDKLQIINYCRSQGFRDAKILNTQFYVRSGDPSMNIRFHLKEGQQYRIGSIKWAGNQIYSSYLLSKLLKIKAGDIYNSVLLKERLSSMMIDDGVPSLYYNNGYLHYMAVPVEVGVKNNVIDIEIRIREGYQSTIDRIIVRGNKTTQDNVILRELHTLPGDKFSGAALKRSYRELLMLNLFDPMIGINPLPNAKEKTVDISYKVKESPKFELKLNGTYGANGLEGGVTIFTNNASIRNIFRKRLPMGAAQDISLELSFNGRDSYKFSTKFVDPYISEKHPIRLSWGASIAGFSTYRKDDTVLDDPRIVDNKEDKEAKGLALWKKDAAEKRKVGKNFSLGTNFSIAKKLFWLDYSQIRVGSSYSYRKYDGEFSLLKKNGNVMGHIHDISLDISLIRNSTNDPIFPTEGSAVTLQFITTLPYSLLSKTPNIALKPELTDFKFKEYHQTMLDVSYFLSIVGKLVLNVRGHIGFLGNYQKRIGPFERFSMGGTMLQSNDVFGKEYIMLRGYEDESIKPLDGLTGYKGGVLYDKLTFELRYPIISSGIIHLCILSFIEAGNTWAEYKKFSILRVNKSAGFGARLYVGVVLNTIIGLDFGYPFDAVSSISDSKEREMVAQVSIGMGLR
jgi:outer membrane protein insertion porin family